MNIIYINTSISIDHLLVLFLWRTLTNMLIKSLKGLEEKAIGLASRNDLLANSAEFAHQRASTSPTTKESRRLLWDY